MSILTSPLQSYPPRLYPQVTNQPNPTVPLKATLRPHVHLIQHALTPIHTKSSPLINENSNNQTQFRHLYIVVCHFVKACILYVQPTYSSDFLSSRDFLLTVFTNSFQNLFHFATSLLLPIALSL